MRFRSYSVDRQEGICLTETEIKLSCESRTRLLSAFNDDLIQGAAVAPAETLDMRSVYYDTADHALHAAHCALRFRAENGIGRITVKTDPHPADAVSDVPGLAVRGEYECAAESLAEGLPRLLPLLPPETSGMLSGLLPGIAPIASVEFRRIEQAVCVSGAVIAFALDEGFVNGCPSASFFELEAELKHGSAETLRSVCARLAEKYALSPVETSKLRRALDHRALANP